MMHTKQDFRETFCFRGKTFSRLSIQRFVFGTRLVVKHFILETRFLAKHLQLNIFLRQDLWWNIMLKTRLLVSFCTWKKIWQICIGNISYLRQDLGWNNRFVFKKKTLNSAFLLQTRSFVKKIVFQTSLLVKHFGSFCSQTFCIRGNTSSETCCIGDKILSEAFCIGDKFYCTLILLHFFFCFYSSSLFFIRSS